MEITLSQVGDTVSDVLNRFKTIFSLSTVTVEGEKVPWMPSVLDSDTLIKMYSIRELKKITDFFTTALNVADLTPPKRNSKVSLAGWIAEVLLSVRGIAEASGAMISTESIVESGEGSPNKNYWCPQCEVWMNRSRASEAPKQITDVADQVPGSSSPEEVLEPENKPVYRISIIAKLQVSEERVNCLPPYLIDRKGNLFKRLWYRSCDAGYAEITSKHLSSIAADSGLVIKLMTEDLEVSQACICGDLPPFIIDKGGVYKHDRMNLRLAARYVQVVSEYLSNIAV